mmetsp:Transcript_52241/g.78017  ORF Transcript_52241/g.78017 Transcript_52241/m.78017 type:complete len:157 (-) Transcript_52241:64-534(-)
MLSLMLVVEQEAIDVGKEHWGCCGSDAPLEMLVLNSTWPTTIVVPPPVSHPHTTRPLVYVLHLPLPSNRDNNWYTGSGAQQRSVDREFVCLSRTWSVTNMSSVAAGFAGPMSFRSTPFLAAASQRHTTNLADTVDYENTWKEAWGEREEKDEESVD